MRSFAALLLLAGCATSLGPVGMLSLDADVVGTKLLRPRVEGRSCRSAVLGVPLRAGPPSLEEALAQMLARDAEGNLVTRAEVRARTLLTGIYNRRCIEVRGDIARASSRLILPAPAGHVHEQH